LIAGVQDGAEEKDCANAAHNLREVCGFLGMKRAAKQGKFAVA